MAKIASLADSMDALFGIDGLTDDLKEAMILGASAAGGLLVGSIIIDDVLPKVMPASWIDTDNTPLPMVASVSGIVLGAVGGIMVGRHVNRAAGAGLAAGLIGWGIARLVNSVLPASIQSSNLGDVDFDKPGDMEGLGRGEDYYFRGLGAGNNDSLLLGLGMGDTSNTTVMQSGPALHGGVGAFTVQQFNPTGYNGLGDGVQANVRRTSPYAVAGSGIAGMDYEGPISVKRPGDQMRFHDADLNDSNSYSQVMQ